MDNGSTTPEGPGGAPTPDEEPTDYGYDLAHEAGAQDGSKTLGTGEDPHVAVATETADQGGDYSYDLAHDIPPAQP